VKILTTDAVGSFPIYFQNERTRAVHCALPNGKAWSLCDCELDLVNIPQKLVCWVNIHKGVVGPRFVMITHATEADAREHSNDQGYIETRQIEVEVP